MGINKRLTGAKRARGYKADSHADTCRTFRRFDEHRRHDDGARQFLNSGAGE